MIDPDDIPKELRGWLIGKWAVLMTGIAATLGAAISSAVLILAVKAYDRLDGILTQVVPAIRESIVTTNGRIDVANGRTDALSAVVIVQVKKMDRAERDIFEMNARIR